MECSICLEQFNSSSNTSVILECNHIYHKNCIKKWLKNNDGCPMCRQETEDKIKWDFGELDYNEKLDIIKDKKVEVNHINWRHDTSTKDNFCLIL